MYTSIVRRQEEAGLSRKFEIRWESCLAVASVTLVINEHCMHAARCVGLL